MAYASFGSGQSPEYLKSAQDCYAAGKAWALHSPKKLPRVVAVEGKEYQIVGSRTVQARGFVAGWKAGKEETKKKAA